MTNPSSLELRHLRYFVAVVDDPHIGRAADRLHISQPPLSRAIQELEERLGVLLLRRTRRVVPVTDAGKRFADDARAVLAAVEDAVARIHEAGGVQTPL